MFRYDTEVLRRFPTIRAGVVVVEGIDNTRPVAALTDAFVTEQQRVRAELAALGSLADVPSIAAWRRTFSAFGVAPTKYRNAAEALLRRLQKQGDLPSLSPLVDIGNLVSIRHRIPVAVIDLDRVQGGVTVTIATGEEHFDDLGGTEGDHPQAGEVVFVDDAGEVAARRWCWRQSHASAVQPATTRSLIVAEAHHDDAEGATTAALDSFGALFADYAPTASLRTALAGPNAPVVD